MILSSIYDIIQYLWYYPPAQRWRWGLGLGGGWLVGVGVVGLGVGDAGGGDEGWGVGVGMGVGRYWIHVVRPRVAKELSLMTKYFLRNII